MSEKIVRTATLQDVWAIHSIISSYPEELIVRPLNNIVENIDRFNVVCIDDVPIACACWQILPEIGNPDGATVELQSVAVKQEFRGQKIGTDLINFVIRRIKAFNPRQALVLTFEPRFFGHLGFERIEKTRIIHKIYRGCVYCTKHTDPFTCPEIAMALDLTKIEDKK